MNSNNQNCKCENIAMGSYKRQIWVHAPSHMPKENGYCLDLCIAQEIMQLWMKGITTTGCCCGHNSIDGYISVIESDIPKMHEIGYKEYNHPDDRKDHFNPKYDRLL